MDKIIIRPSSVDSFFTCAYQWYNVFILGKVTIPSARAAIGTAIHAAAEVLWKDAIIANKKDANRSMLKDAAIAEFQELDKDILVYDTGENSNTAESAVCDGVDAFVDDIVPFTDIPLAVEERYTIKLDHPVVESLSGTVDYISTDTIADLKTSKRKPVPTSYTTQQTIYKMLAEANGHTITHNMIQGVVLKKQPEGHILELVPKEDQARYLVNSILDVLDIYYMDMIDPKALFRGNTKHYLCSPKYCSLYEKECPYVKGEVKVAPPSKVKL